MPFNFQNGLEDPDEDGEMNALEDYTLFAQRVRRLPDWIVAEIRSLEGYKPAKDVGREFGIGAQRVRGIWDGAND